MKGRFNNVKADSGKHFSPQESSSKVPGLSHPAFSLRYIVDTHCITSCSDQQAAQFANKVRMLTSLSWQEIIQLDRHKLGCEKISRDSMRVPIPRHVTEDVNLLAFRCFGMAPMVGYRDQGVFYVLWFDSGFDVYDHG